MRRVTRWRSAAAAALALLVGVGLLAWRPSFALEGYIALERWRAGAEVVHARSAAGDLAMVVAGPEDAPEIVLLHGFTGSKENWLPLMAELASDYRVIAPDLPGWGESTREPGGNYGVVAQSGRIGRWLASRPHPPAMLVGHSMGGHIAALVAAEYPDQVPRLALLSAAGVPFKANPFVREILAGGHPFAVADRASLDRYLGLVFTDPPFLPWPADRAYIARRIADLPFERDVLERMHGPEAFAVQPLLPGIAAPTLLLWCRDDRVIDASAAGAYAAGLPQSRTVLLDGCGHMPMMADPEAVAAAIRSQLAGD